MLIILIFLFGLAIGSFLNVVILRLRFGGSFIIGHSKCPKCRHRLAWFDNLPLLSFALLRGRCRYCHKPISWQYPLVELATAVLFLLSAQQVDYQLFIINYQSLELLLSCFIISVLIIIFVYDFRWYLVDDRVVLPAIVLIFAGKIFLGESWFKLLGSGIIVAGFFLLQFLISRGKWLGAGDIRIGFLAGVILGWPLSLVALFLAYIFGSLVSLPLIIFKAKKMSSKIPFGPFLAVAILAAMFWGRLIFDWYLSCFYYGF